jgi:hypothetical protein
VCTRHSKQSNISVCRDDILISKTENVKSYTSQSFFRRTGSNTGNSEIVLICKGPRILNLYEVIIKREGMKGAPRMIGKSGGCQLEHGVTDVLHTHALHILFALLSPLFVLLLLLYRLPIPSPIVVWLYHTTFVYSILLHFRSLPSPYNSYSRWTGLKPDALIRLRV